MRKKKTYPNKLKLKEFIATRTPLQKKLKGILQIEMEGC